MSTSGTPPNLAYFIDDNSAPTTVSPLTVDDLFPGTRPYSPTSDSTIRVVPLVTRDPDTFDANFIVKMYRSTDSGATWAIADSANSFVGPKQSQFAGFVNPTTCHNAGDVCQVTDRLYLAYWDSATLKLTVTPFNMTTGLWEAAVGTAGPDFFHSNQNAPASVLICPRGTDFILAVNFPAVIGITYWHVEWWKLSGGVWTDIGEAGTVAQANYHYPQGLWKTADSAVHLLYYAENNLPAENGLHHQSLSSLDVRSADTYLLGDVIRPPGWQTQNLVVQLTVYPVLPDSGNSCVYSIIQPSFGGSLAEGDDPVWFAPGTLALDGSTVAYDFLQVDDLEYSTGDDAGNSRQVTLTFRPSGNADIEGVVFREISKSGSGYVAYFYLPTPLTSGQHRSWWAKFYDDGTPGSLVPTIHARTLVAGAGTPAFSGAAEDFYVSTWAQTSADGVVTRVLGSVPVVTASAALTISCGSPPDGTVGVAYSHDFSATTTGGTPPYTWAITVGALPDGLSLDASTGIASGTPTLAGTFSFTIQVQDSAAGLATVDCSITIVGGTLGLACGSPPAGTVGTVYSHTLVTSGGVPPFAYVLVSGTLPPGLALGASDGSITGVPTTTGSYVFRVRVTDSLGSTADVTCSIVIAAAGGNCPDAPEYSS